MTDTTPRRAAPRPRSRASASTPVAPVPAAPDAAGPPAAALPRDRRLTLGTAIRDRCRDGFWVGTRRFPVLRLAGQWLAQAGFAPGQRVQVRVDAGRLVIEPAD